MKIIIVENELYLAQSIQNNLTEKLNAKCEIYASYYEAIDTNGDIYIVNTNLQGSIENLIEAKKEKIIILLVPYVTYTTVTQPLEMGADDFIQKPFSIEELIRKIKHLITHYELKNKTKKLEEFIEYFFKNIEIDEYELNFPLFIKTNSKKAVEKLIFEYAKKHNFVIKIVDLNTDVIIPNKNTIYYAPLFYANDKLINKLSKYNTIIIAPKKFENIYSNYNLLEIEVTKKSLFEDEILSLEEYIKFIIISHQNNLPDTELSKKLGISRKSLWEKRKKYGIFKQK